MLQTAPQRAERRSGCSLGGRRRRLRGGAVVVAAVVALASVTACSKGADTGSQAADATLADAVTTVTTAAPTTTTTVAPTTTTTAAPVTPVPGQPVPTGSKGPAVQQLQQRLVEMGYWLPGVDGVFASATTHAVTAFQKTNGLPRSGQADAATLASMATAPRPTAAKPTAGRSLEVDLNRQILMVINGGRVENVLDISSGKPSTPTPRGDFKIQRQIDGLRISDLGELWRPKYFTGGYALHGSSSVPPTAASHGCVRLTNAGIDWLWASGVAPVGTPLSVY